MLFSKKVGIAEVNIKWYEGKRIEIGWFDSWLYI